MASTYTDIGTELMTTGENAGTWGATTNTNIQILEEAIRGYVAVSIAGSADTTALTYTDGSTGDSARNAVIALTGTMTGNQVVTVTAKEKWWIVDNQTSGAYTVQFMVSGQTGVTWGTSDKGTKILYCNGTDVVDTNIGGGVGAQDLNGEEFILDADADTSITADTDDQIDIKIAGADDFQFTANTFTAQAGSTIAAQALTATTVTASGIVKTDDTTEATSTTDGSLQTDGGLSVAKDAVLGDDLKLLSDSAVLSFGADSDTTLTHTDGTGLTLNSTNKLLFRDTGLYINSSTDGQLDLVADTEIQIAATTIDINGAVALNGAITGATDITLSGELDAATLDISGNADIDGTLEADAITINGTAIGSIYGVVAGSSSIVTTGALDSGSITSGFGTIDTGSSTITTTGLITGGSLDIDNVLINGTTIGHTDDTDLMTVADGVLTIAGELDATTLDISGNADIDGTLEADAITVDGTTLAEYIADTAGAMVSSNTETGITVTYQDGDNTIDFALAAAQTTITSLLATDIKIGEDDETKIDFETADEIHFYAANTEQVYVGDNIFGPQSDSDVDLGSSSVRWKDAYVDTVTSTSTITTGAGVVIADAGNIGSASDTDAIAIASNGVVTFSQTPVLSGASISAGTAPLTALDIDGATDIGEAIVDADLFIVDNGAGGTNRKVAASRIVTYIDANSSAASVGKAIAMAIVFG